ncbi:MAG: hypothetical protein AAF219_09435 [Myxococcota bacterium]
MSEVSAFFDTNVLLYLLSADAAKADQAEDQLTVKNPFARHEKA